ncbi:MAG: hypothetical protein LBU60_02870 [Clostridiales bacterium]|jgi:protein arginine kinase activator|nr:hypothetical protein [Clostridiales bacterium]
MLCQNCNKNPATYRSIKNINGQVTETALCNACRRTLHDNAGLNNLAKDLSTFGSLNSFADFLNMVSSSGLDRPSDNVPAIVCPNCKTTFAEFRKSLYVGCGQCYYTFFEQLLPMLETIQHGISHVGKTPKGREILDELRNLEQEIRKAIVMERYEDAIVLREQLNKLKNKK